MLFRSQIFVNPGVTVNISNITLDATNNGVPACGPLEPLAILYQDSSGTVNRVDVKNETTPCLNSAGSPNPQGEGVLVQSDGAMPAVVTVEHSAFSNIGLNNIEGDGAGTTITVDNNTIVGPGDTAGNGIYITQAAGAVTNNKISNALHLGETSGFFGIIGECSSAFSATGNEVSNTVLGIYIIDPLTIGGNPPGPCGTTGYTITGNQIFHTSAGPSFGVPGNGIEVCGPNNTIQNNLINDSAQSGIALDPSCGNTANMVSGNRINGACAAVLQSPDSVGNNVIQPNAIFNSKFLLVNGTSCQ